MAGHRGAAMADGYDCPLYPGFAKQNAATRRRRRSWPAARRRSLATGEAWAPRLAAAYLAGRGGAAMAGDYDFCCGPQGAARALYDFSQSHGKCASRDDVASDTDVVSVYDIVGWHWPHSC